MSLRDLVQHRILTDIFAKCQKAYPGWTVLILDKESTRVLSHAVGMYDIMEQHIMLVEDLTKKRAPFPDKAAIYLVAPTEASVKRLLEDFSGPKPLYGQAVFVYFLGRVSDSLVERLKECRPLLSRLKTFAELNIDFIAKESRAYHLDLRSSFRNIYGKRSKVEHFIADKLLTVCATLHEYPHVRYPRQSRFCHALAKAFNSKMEHFLRSNPDFWYYGDGIHMERDRSSLLLLDRKDDLLSPLMHEFTYQALVEDLLPLTEDDIITIEMEDPSGKPVKQDLLLNEKDALWVELRSKHIADVGQILSSRIREMINSDTSQIAKNDKGTMSVQQMSNALRDLPEYREVMSKLSQHLRLSQKCWDKLKEGQLVDLSQLEQTLATGKDEDGRSPKVAEMVAQVEEELGSMTDTVNKMRLLMILFISQKGISQKFKDRVFKAANLRGSAERVINKLELLGVPLVSEHEGSRVSALFGGKAIKAAGGIDEDTEYNSRYLPPLQSILEDLINHRLSMEEFPSLLPMPEMSAAGVTSVSAGSARKRDGSARKGSTTSRWAKASTSSGTEKTSGLFSGGRSLVFYVGGVCYSELRVARTVMEKENKEIIMGSTHFTKPKEFLRDIDKIQMDK